MIETSLGLPSPLGFSLQGKRANFAVFSSHATHVFLGLFQGEGKVREIPLIRTGDIWHIAIDGLPLGTGYAYRCEGPHEGPHLYNPAIWLADPYAKALHQNRSVADLPQKFDWQGVKPPSLASSDLIIYEMHVRGFTQHPSSGVSHRGTYLGFIEKIPFLKKLGINAVELMPVFDTDPHHCKNLNPKTGEPLVNYWGYDPYHFFIPKQWFSVSDPLVEFKTLVRELHRNGIQVILDVVYNHSGEGEEKDFYINFRGLDNAVYYLVDDQGEYLDFTGCGNTLNTNHPVVQQLILDSLRYWVEEMHVDGFRFDLASILTRDPKGKPMTHPLLIEAISQDPLLSKVHLIAEAWDASGLYQLGSFPKWGPWSEWNGRYRDIVRRFIKGTDAKAGLFANVLCGSEMIYRNSGTPLSSINFITAHDGFSLRDLVTYQGKHNYDNGEGNRDGANQNDNWNCGTEGPTQDSQILALRERQMRNFLLALFLAQGIPMLYMNDVYGHTRLGNNNPYVQDNEINWFSWEQLQKNEKIFNFVSSLIAFRKKHSHLRFSRFLTDDDVDWHGTTPFQPHFDCHSRFIAFTLKPSLYIAFNANYQPAQITLPPGSWHTVINTQEDWQFHKQGPLLSASLELVPYSALVATQKS